MKRLLDGQFEDCGLTLEELRIIEQSLVKVSQQFITVE